MDRATQILSMMNEEQGKSGKFVVQEHHATNLHYDFRLEIGGTFKSWAVPKGPSMNPSEKRFATPTDDHSHDDAHFEGVIPKGKYGAGLVKIYDKGSYSNLVVDKGSYSFDLHGSKLKGHFRLQKTSSGFLLIKAKDEHAKDSSGLDQLHTKAEAKEIIAREHAKQEKEGK